MMKASEKMAQRVQANLANQANKQHLDGVVEQISTNQDYEDHVKNYTIGVIEMKIAKLGPQEAS